MTVYYILIAGVLLVYAFVFKTGESKVLVVDADGVRRIFENRRTVYCVIMGLIVFFILTCGAETVGTDRHNYHDMYDTLPEVYMPTYAETFPRLDFWFAEPFFFVLSYALKSLNIGFGGFLAVVYAFWIFAVFRLIRMYSKDVMLGTLFFVCLGMFFVSFTALRQTMAMTFVALAFPSLKRGKPIRYFLLILCAALCHISAAVMAVMYFFRYIRLRRRMRIILLIAAVLAAVVISAVLPAALSSFNGIARGLKYIEEIQPANPLTLLIAVAYGVFILFLEKLSKKNADDALHNVLFLVLCMYIGIMISCREYATLNRLAYYCMLFIPICLANAIEAVSDYRSRFIIKIACFVVMIAYLTVVIPGSYLGVDNYRFAWEQNVRISQNSREEGEK